MQIHIDPKLFIVPTDPSKPENTPLFRLLDEARKRNESRREAVAPLDAEAHTATAAERVSFAFD